MLQRRFKPLAGRWVIILLAIVLCGTLLVNTTNLDPASRSYLMTPDVYLAFQWVDQHVPPEAEVLLLYGDLYQEGGLAMRHRHMNIELHSLFKFGTNNFTDRNISVSIPEPGTPISRIFNQSRIQSIEEQRKIRREALSHTDICNFDYYVLDRFSSFVPGSRLILFNAGFVQRTAERNATAVVYLTDRVAILQNLRKGEPCV